QTIKSVYREGKELHFQFSKDDVLGLHLMLHGALSFTEIDEVVKHAVLELVFDEKKLALTDWQRAAKIKLNPEPSDVPDALSNDVNYEFLKTALQKRTTIKNFLLDQKMIRGIGNAYADEILWDAGISPFSICKAIPDKAIKKLAHSIHKILADAEKNIKKADPQRISGELREFLVIHNSKKKTSPTNAPIQYKMVASRKTYFTNEQELFE
ncbi:MAG: DNA-formamidopyrimidine glycosylase, partial [Marivirga sp.]|nr:DNA-formamidopyrimidine glycosylase [Marivirga sp.]